MATIQLQSLMRRYGQRRGIERLTLTVPEGALFGFLGPNGAGKSTTIRVLLGFLRPTAGRASIFGQDCWQAGHRIRSDIGYMPGDFRFYPWMNGREALRLMSMARHRDISSSGRALAE